MDAADQSDVCTFLDLLESLSLVQHVTQPTHVDGHILDLIITCSSDNIIQDLPYVDHFISDYALVLDKLKLNDGKTEFMVIGTKQQLSKVNVEHLIVGESSITPVCVANNLGTWFNSNLSFKEHINKTCRAAYFHLNNIRRIRKYLSNESTQILVHAFIIGRLGYCNSLLYGVPDVHLGKLQRVQNSAEDSSVKSQDLTT